MHYLFPNTNVIHWNICIYIFIQVTFEIEMRDNDGNHFREIDMFMITATFPSNNQDQVFTRKKER